jgi:hypothetical protein
MTVKMWGFGAKSGRNVQFRGEISSFILVLDDFWGNISHGFSADLPSNRGPDACLT